MNKTNNSFVKYIRLTILLFLLVIAIGYYTLVNYKPKNTFHERFIEVETGSPQWWKMVNNAEEVHLRDIERFQPESKDYKIREIWIRLFREEKKDCRRKAEAFT